MYKVNWNTEESKKKSGESTGGNRASWQGEKLRLLAEFVDAAGLAPGNSRDLSSANEIHDDSTENGRCREHWEIAGVYFCSALRQWHHLEPSNSVWKYG